MHWSSPGMCWQVLVFCGIVSWECDCGTHALQALHEEHSARLANGQHLRVPNRLAISRLTANTNRRRITAARIITTASATHRPSRRPVFGWDAVVAFALTGPAPAPKGFVGHRESCSSHVRRGPPVRTSEGCLVSKPRCQFRRLPHA